MLGRAANRDIPRKAPMMQSIATFLTDLSTGIDRVLRLVALVGLVLMVGFIRLGTFGTILPQSSMPPSLSDSRQVLS